ncbi:MAG: AraC family transcriptional regulator [Thermoplasmata archaeon]|jgi:AraC family transcriptional regulator of arabinose operon
MAGIQAVSSGPRHNVLPADAGARFDVASRPGGKDRLGKIEDCIAYMEAHIDQPLRVATLAALANLSPSHFFALFKRHTGCPPKDYFTRLRMQHARRLLGSGSASVKEVAAALGYADPFYFSRVFKSVNQVAPSKFISSTPAPIQFRPGHAPGKPC